ncbi:MAG: hypothetical protein J6Q85_02015 [Clostridia bacterium]|nr:hypothetical protein [Clostridia bacterium]
MKYPKLKNALLCRILTYVVVFGAFAALLSIVLAVNISETLKIVLVIGISIGLIVYLFLNLSVLMFMDIMLTTLHCRNTARRQFKIPDSRTTQSIEKSLTRYGREYEPIAITPRPTYLGYKFSSPITVYSSGIERVVAIYHTDLLDKDTYHSIFRSADANSRMLQEKKKPLFLDKSQRESPLNRVTVIVIFATRVEDNLKNELYDMVCKNDGEGWSKSVVPCVIDLSDRICVFNCERIPYCGMQYPVKNRGIRIIRKRVFGGRLPLRNNAYTLPSLDGIDTESSLWKFWGDMIKENISVPRENKKRYGSMSHGELVFDDGILYVKWQDKGLLLGVELDEERKIAIIDEIDLWYYPKANEIGKDTVRSIEGLITAHFAMQGYSCQFGELDE